MNAPSLMKVGRPDNHHAHPTSARHRIAKVDGAGAEREAAKGAAVTHSSTH